MDLVAQFVDAGRIVQRREIPILPDGYEPAALYLAIAYTTRAEVIAAPDQVLDRLRDLGWLRAIRSRVSPAAGVGMMDCCGIAWLDLELIKRALKKDQGERFAREVLALQLELRSPT